MDEEHYRAARDSVSQPRCVYELALQHGQFVCPNKRVMQLGEREALYCTDTSARADCQCFYALCLSHSGFALGDAQLPMHLSFNKTVKVQMGGLQGVAALLALGEDLPAHNVTQGLLDVTGLLSQLKQHAGAFEAIDFSQIMPFINHFNLRKGRSRNKSS